LKTTTKAVLVALAIFVTLAVAIPTTALKPIHNQNDTAPAMDPAHPYYGSVSGRVTTSNTTVGLPSSYVAIVNASNTSQAFYEGTTDANGFYQFAFINNTYVGNQLMYGYKVYANHSLFGEGLSNVFWVEQNSTAAANVVISPRPAKIVLTATRNNVVADDADHVTVSAYVTDALGNAVPDNTPINFWINETPWDHSKNGSLSSNDQWQGVQEIDGVRTSGGWANVTFGWVNETWAGNNSTIEAYFAEDRNINASIDIYFNPTLAAWFGSVCDTYGAPLRGGTVILHLMGYNYSAGGAIIGSYEVYNMTVSTAVELPYPGAFVFDNIELNSSVKYGYATAEYDVGDGVIYRGASDNYTLNKSRTSSGFIVLHVPMPDAIKLTPDPDTILVGGDQSVITAQLFLNGKEYKRPGVTVEFFGDNDTIGTLPSVKTNMTNAAGQAAIILTSNQTKGDVNVTGFTKPSISRNLTDTCVVHVVGWGTISGMVTDKNKNGIPNATVTLWTTKWQNGTYENQKKVNSLENPQQTVSRPEIAAIGTYTYYRIPSGYYNVTAEKADSAGNVHIWFAWVNLTAGTATNNVALPDYVVPTLPTATPTVAPTVAATVAPTVAPTAAPTAVPTPTPAPGFETVFALAGLLGVAYLVVRKNN